MPSKVSKNKKPLEIEKNEEPDNKMNKQQQKEGPVLEQLLSESESKVLELALLNSDSDIEEESPVIERVKNIKQKDSVKIVKDSPSDTQSYTQTKAKRERTEKQKEQFQKALEVKKLNAERRKEEQRPVSYTHLTLPTKRIV